MTSEHNDKVFKILQGMSTKNVLIIYLRSVREMTLKEIADRVDMTPEGVRKRIIKIKKRIHNGISE